jgi:hypothetical protein
MSVNKYKRHIFVLPEDDANRQMANGFVLEASVDQRTIQVLPNSGGWSKAREDLGSHFGDMKRYADRYMVLLVDFDRSESRLGEMKSRIPKELADRVFVIGVWSEPEELSGESGVSLEQIGLKLAEECRDGSRSLWSHRLLQHNAAEVDRMIGILKPFLFTGK